MQLHSPKSLNIFLGFLTEISWATAEMFSPQKIHIHICRQLNSSRQQVELGNWRKKAGISLLNSFPFGLTAETVGECTGFLHFPLPLLFLMVCMCILCLSASPSTVLVPFPLLIVGQSYLTLWFFADGRSLHIPDRRLLFTGSPQETAFHREPTPRCKKCF